MPKPVSNSAQRWRLRATGTVQGVGFRPFIYRLARAHGCAGWVRNTGDGVLIEVEGPEAALAQFRVAIATEAPPLARIATLECEIIPAHGAAAFVILASAARDADTAGIPPDIATCPACLTDIADPANRRYGYPFTNCTDCGPRFTIITAVPYDRPNTTMREFNICPCCRAEYDDPANRRFHAQPNACPACGPHLWLDGHAGDDTALIAATADLLRAGRIVAVKGLGGYHLACDARNAAAVRELRARKQRGAKPFAVMCANLDDARALCVIDDATAALLEAPERPIVLLPALPDNGIAPDVAPGVRTLGLLLPYAPLHHLLLAACGSPLVLTSGNLSDEPIAIDDGEARARLGRLADRFLAHTRPIHLACDDSVARVVDGTPTLLRRARGYVPLPLALPCEAPSIFAAGGDGKNAFCLTKGREALLSQHLGDLDNPVALAHYERMVAHFRAFYDVRPEIVAHDLHPDYQSTRLARAWPDVAHVGVQHHHAHIAACMAEHGLDEPVIGVAYDGTGFGTDGGIWGGEILVADYASFRRAAHLAKLPLPGGEAAIRHPGRIALGCLRAAGLDAPLPLEATEARVVETLLARGLNTPKTTSMGRLLDAIAALLGICAEVTYEGQAAIELEARAGAPTGRYPYALRQEDGLIMDWAPLLAVVVADMRAGAPVAAIAANVHATIAAMTADTCARLREETGLARVALSGGVFQNMLLLDDLTARLRAAGFTVYTHCRVPCNDGGLALGQAIVAAHTWKAS